MDSSRQDGLGVRNESACPAKLLSASWQYLQTPWHMRNISFADPGCLLLLQSPWWYTEGCPPAARTCMASSSALRETSCRLPLMRAISTSLFIRRKTFFAYMRIPSFLDDFNVAEGADSCSRVNKTSLSIPWSRASIYCPASWSLGLSLP